MKKILKTAALVSALVMAFSLFSCSEDEDNGSSLPALPKSQGVNNLKGQHIEYGAVYDFGTSTYTRAYETEYPAVNGVYDSFIRKTVITYKYTVDNSMSLEDGWGVIYFREVSKKVTLMRNGKEFYTCVLTPPKTFAAFKELLLKETKAIALDKIKDSVNEALMLQYRGNRDIYREFENFGYEDTTGAAEVPEEMYAAWYKYHVNEIAYNKAHIERQLYKLNTNSLDFDELPDVCVPYGLKLGDIFKGRYEAEFSDELQFHEATYTRNHPQFYIDEDNMFTILSASNDKLICSKVTGGPDAYGFAPHDPSQKITIPVKYSALEVSGNPQPEGVTVTLTYDGREYSADIYYITKNSLNYLAQ